jgi:mRNA interferase RelE/StbE
MKTAFTRSFAQDLKKRAKQRKLLSQVREVILEVEAAEAPASISNIKKLKTDGPYYRIRVGDYRLGLIIEAETVTFVRLLHRKEIYRYFPLRGLTRRSRI